MYKELPEHRYDLLYNIDEIGLFPIISSVVYLKQKGKIYVDDPANPSVFFIAHQSSFCYLYATTSFSIPALLDFLYSTTDVPQYFHIYNASDQLLETAGGRKDYNNKVRKRMRMNRVDDFDYNSVSHNGFVAKSIEDVSMSELSVFDLKVFEKFWNSTRDFVDNGFGWVIFDNDKPVSIWYALSVVNGNSETDILTLPEYRGRGLATIAGSLILKTLDEKQIIMDWDVFEDNTPSVKIAERFGYKPYFHYPLLSLFKNL